MQIASGGSSFRSLYASPTVERFIQEHGDDVASSGVFVETEAPLGIGTLLRFELRLATNETVLSGQARVRWRREPKLASKGRPAGMGLSFLELDDASRTLVARITAEHPKAGVRFTGAPENDAPQVSSERFIRAPEGVVPSLSSDDLEAEEEHEETALVVNDREVIPSLADDPIDGDAEPRDRTLVMPSANLLRAALPIGPSSSQRLLAGPPSSQLIVASAPDSRRELPVAGPSGAKPADGAKGNVVITSLLAIIAGALLLIAIVLVLGGAYFARSLGQSASSSSASAVLPAPTPRPSESVVTVTASAAEPSVSASASASPSPKPSAVASPPSAPAAPARGTTPAVASPRPAPIRRPPPPRAPAVPAWATD